MERETFAYNVMSFGLCNAPITFQRAMTTPFQEHLRKFIEIFLDDFCVFSTKANHAQYLNKCFEKCEKLGISINAPKFEFVVPCGRLVEYIESQSGVAVDPNKLAAILKLSIPNQITAVKAFLGATSYYRHHIYLYIAIASPVIHLTKQVYTPCV